MRQLVYAQRFTGRATPAGPDGSVLTVAATAPGPMPVVTPGLDEPAGALAAIPSGEAVLDAEMTLTGESSFQEIGTIAFGEGHRLHFGTIGSGYLGPSADPTLKHGTVMWRIEGGEGQFAGASGLITSNFVVGDELSVTDHHFGVIFLP